MTARLMGRGAVRGCPRESEPEQRERDSGCDEAGLDFHLGMKGGTKKAHLQDVRAGASQAGCAEPEPEWRDILPAEEITLEASVSPNWKGSQTLGRNSG